MSHSNQLPRPPHGTRRADQAQPLATNAHPLFAAQPAPIQQAMRKLCAKCEVPIALIASEQVSNDQVWQVLIEAATTIANYREMDEDMLAYLTAKMAL